MPAQEPYPGESMIPLPPDGFGSFAWWEDVIKGAEDVRDPYLSDWQTNVQRYLGKTKRGSDEIAVNVDFYNTEQKKAQLYFRTPEIQLTAKQPQLEDAVVIFQAVVNHYLGPQKTNLFATMDECLFDVLCPAGLWACKIGYEAIQDGTVMVQVGMAPGAPPMGDVIGLSPTPMVPDLQPAPRIIHERYFIDRISPAKLLRPREFHDSDHDKAWMLGFEFVEDLEVAKRKGWVPEDFQGSGEDKHRLTPEPNGSETRPIVIAREIWYRAARIDPTEKHPERFRQLLLIDGLKQPAIHRNSPYQKFDEATGKLVAGMRGNPIQVGTLRYVADSAFPPSDCTISRAQVDELSDARTHFAKQRRKNISLRWFDRNRVDPTDIDRIKRADIQGLIPLDGNGNEIIGEVARADMPKENLAIINVIQQDVDKEWALGGNQNGVTEDTVRSATELSIIQNNINVRQDYERAKLLAQVIRIAEKLGSLIQLFADQEDYIEIVGEDGAKRLEAWDKTRIQGEFAYSAKPDSTQRLDAAQDRKQYNDYLNFNAKNPNINLVELTRIGAQKYNYDPQRIVTQPPPPSPTVESFAVSAKIEDFAGPAGHVAFKMATQVGWKLVPDDLALAQVQGVKMAQAEQAQAEQQHGGTADKADVLSKHSGEETGQLPGNTSAPAVM